MTSIIGAFPPPPSEEGSGVEALAAIASRILAPLPGKRITVSIRESRILFPSSVKSFPRSCPPRMIVRTSSPSASSAAMVDS
ncbi:hypothetical protein HY213_00390, partial [Candidatus Peregrinibacteria bacterium]|nr:hypothetical protein [Candidatus Peregrinibacteria bacterium]